MSTGFYFDEHQSHTLTSQRPLLAISIVNQSPHSPIGSSCSLCPLASFLM